DVAPEGGQPVVLQIEVLVELARQGREPDGDVHAPHLDRERRCPVRRRRGERREVRIAPRAFARPDEAGADPEEPDADEDGPDGSTTPQALPPPCRCPTLAKSLVR